MAIYEYVCQRKRPKVCGHITEKIMPMSENGSLPVKCEKCGGRAVRVEISKSDFHLRTGGFYATDYKKRD